MAEVTTTTEQQEPNPNPAPPAEPQVQAAAAEPQTAAPAQPAAFDLNTLDEATQVQIINKAMGTSYKTLAEAQPKKELTQEERDAASAKRKTDSLQWAFGTGKITKEQYDLAIAEKSKNPRDIAYALFAKEERDENPKASDEDIAIAFSDFYREEELEDSASRKKAMRLMNKVVNEHLSVVSKPIDSIESDYDSYTTTEQKFSSYSGQVKAVAQALPTEIVVPLSYKTADGKEETIEYKILVEESVLTAVIKEYQNSNMFFAIGADGKEVKDSDLSKEMLASVENRILRKAIPGLLKQHEERVETDLRAHLKGIPHTGPATLAPGEQKSGGVRKEIPTYPALEAFQKRNNILVS